MRSVLQNRDRTDDIGHRAMAREGVVEETPATTTPKVIATPQSEITRDAALGSNSKLKEMQAGSMWSVMSPSQKKRTLTQLERLEGIVKKLILRSAQASPTDPSRSPKKARLCKLSFRRLESTVCTFMSDNHYKSLFHFGTVY